MIFKFAGGTPVVVILPVFRWQELLPVDDIQYKFSMVSNPEGFNPKISPIDQSILETVKLFPISFYQCVTRQDKGVSKRSYL